MVLLGLYYGIQQTWLTLTSLVTIGDSAREHRDFHFTRKANYFVYINRSCGATGHAEGCSALSGGYSGDAWLGPFDTRDGAKRAGEKTELAFRWCGHCGGFSSSQYSA